MKKINFKFLLKKKNTSGDINLVTAWPVNYARDWKIMVLVFAVGLILLSIFSWRIYLGNKIAGGYFVPEINSADVPTKIVDLSRLRNNLLLLDAMQEAFSEFKKDRPKMVDPSL